MNTLLFIDPQTDEKLYYEELLNEVCAGTINYAPFVQPATPGAAVRALLTAVVLGQPLTLFDADFSANERKALGGTDACFVERIGLKGGSWSDPVAMLSDARQQSGFVLTLFTSGSTGLPKRVTHDLAGLTRMLKVNSAHARNIWGLAYNPTHIAGVQVILQAFLNGNPLVHLFQASRASILSAVTDHGITHLSATPSFFRLLLPITDPLQSVLSVTLGGESSNAELLERLHRAFPQAGIHNIYASTEVGSLLVSKGDVFSIPEELEGRVVVHEARLWIHRALMGEGAALPVPSSETVKQSDGDEVVKRSDSETNREEAKRSSGETVSRAQPGDITQRSDEFTDLQSHGITAAPDGAAWYDTGDVVEVVSEAPLRFRIVARERDWVNVGGHKVNPQEVETVLREHPGVRDARVYGRKNSVMGQVLCAEVVLLKVETGKLKTKRGRSALRGDGEAKQKSEITEERLDSSTDLQSHGLTEAAPQLSEAHLRAWLAAHLQPFKISRMIRFVDALGTTRTGKVARR